MKKKILSLLILLLTTLSIQGQVKFPENLEHYDPTKFLVDQEQIKGTHWSVLDEAARNAIPADKREVGMLVTWIESTLYVTKRFEAINALDINWLDNTKWFGMISRIDTVVYADTSFYALQADSSVYADTAFFALIADTANFALGVDAVDSLNFNSVTKTGSHNEGNLIYDTDTKSLSFQNDIADFNHNLGYELVTRVYNATGSTILNGRVCRLVGNFKEAGKITPKIRLAGNGSVDSTLVLGMATVDIPTDSYGIVTLKGEIKGLNTSSIANDSSSIYLGFGGSYIDTVPEPPYFSVNLGQVYYADADSGRIFFNPSLPSYDPCPHISADTSRMANVLDLTQNVFEYLPTSHTVIDHAFGFSVIGDSISCSVSGFITVALNISYIGNVQADVWRKGVFLNAVEVNSVSRSTASVSVGNSTVLATMSVLAGDYISFKMTNETADRDPTVVDLSWQIIFLHL